MTQDDIERWVVRRLWRQRTIRLEPLRHGQRTGRPPRKGCRPRSPGRPKAPGRTATTKRRFGLVFEEHLPERVQLPEHRVRRGTKVVSRDREDDEPREVAKVSRGKAAVCTPDGEMETVAVEDLLVVADFGEPIYPGLRRLGSLKAGGEKPAHVVIEGENHRVLEALEFAHAGTVDCIYIDPPYNSGARDWKYNNHYVVRPRRRA